MCALLPSARMASEVLTLIAPSVEVWSSKITVPEEWSAVCG